MDNPISPKPERHNVSSRSKLVSNPPAKPSVTFAQRVVEGSAPDWVGGQCNRASTAYYTRGFVAGSMMMSDNEPKRHLRLMSWWDLTTYKLLGPSAPKHDTPLTVLPSQSIIRPTG